MLYVGLRVNRELKIFKESYEAPSGHEMNTMKTTLENIISLPAKYDVEKVTGGPHCFQKYPAEI